MTDKLEFPFYRSELVGYLEDLARMEPATMEPFLQEGRDSGFLDFLVHFFFDDTEIAEDPESLIGEIFHNRDEVEAVRPVTAALDAILESHLDIRSSGFDNMRILRSEDWLALRAPAAAALAVLSRG